jgi:YfiH family protein
MRSTIKFIESPLLSKLNLRHGFFQRHGGASRGDFESLNVKTGIGDPDRNIENNLKLALAKLQLNLPSLIFIRHNFGDNILIVDDKTPKGYYNGYDAVIASSSNVVLGQGTADCGSIMISDKNKTFIGLIHGSWHTTKLNIISKFVANASSLYGVKPEDMLVFFGPMLCAKCFEFGDEAADLFDKKYLKSTKFGKCYFNNKQNMIDQLIESGLQPGNIWDSNICTLENEDYFSYRRSKKNGKPSGRFLSSISF